MKVAFDAGNFGLGLLMGASGLGLIVGSLAAGLGRGAVGDGGRLRRVDRGDGDRPRRDRGRAQVWVGAVFVVAMGFGNGVAVVATACSSSAERPTTCAAVCSRSSMSVTYSALFIGMLVGGVLADALGARTAWAVAAVVAGVAAVASYVLARGIPAAPCPSRSRRCERAAGRGRRLRRVTYAAVARRRDWTRETLAAGVRDGRQARARARDHARRELRPARLRGRRRPLPGDGARVRGRRHRPARRRQVDA